MKTIKTQLQKHKNEITAVALIIAFYALLSVLDIGCPIKFFTGVSCAGCGMTRAYIALLHLDIGQAFYYHPLFVIPAVFVVLYYFRKNIPVKLYKGSCACFVGLFLIVYVARFFSQNQDIVVFHPKDGYIFRIINHLTKGELDNVLSKMW